MELREVFFGEERTGQSYVVLCQGEESTAKISSVFVEASVDKSATPMTEFRLLDCDYVLPASGKSIAQRFKLDTKKRPTIFISGPIVGPPKQIPEKYLKTGNMLSQFLRSKLELSAHKIETTQALRSKCLDKDTCALLLMGSKKPSSSIKDAMAKLVKDYPDVIFAAVDSSVLYVLNLEEYIPELQGGQPRFVVFQKMSGSLETGGTRLITSMAALPTNGASHGPMNNLVQGVVQKTQTMTKLPALPSIKTRTKKLEEYERAKRQRRLDQQQRKHEKKSGSSSSGSTDNDGSRDGRRAERDRRRQEHREKHGVKDKTPEEIAEMERRRRARMEEEAAKWNVAPDDAPDAGDFDDYNDMMDDAEYDILDDEDDADDVKVHDGDEDNDEDVIDLD